jgi:fructoselysine-6-phosphate deglycase
MGRMSDNWQIHSEGTRVLNFDHERFVSIQSGAVQVAVALRDVVRDRLSSGTENVFFLGAGGAGVLMLPAAQLLQRRSALRVQLQHAAEIVAMDCASLGPRSLVVIPSLSGTTPESLEVLEFSQDKGATVLSLTADDSSPVARASDINFSNLAADDTSSESFYIQSLGLALAVLDARGELDEYDRIIDELKLLPELLIGVKQSFEPRAADLADVFRDENYHIITGAGPVWAQAWYYGTCILEEMQWIRTRPIHASDFFHGTLELLESDVSVLILKGEDASRQLAERVEAFAPTVSDKVHVLDTADHALPGVSADVRGLVAPIVLATALERLSAHLEVVRDHPLTTRRYYRRVAY